MAKNNVCLRSVRGSRPDLRREVGTDPIRQLCWPAPPRPAVICAGRYLRGQADLLFGTRCAHLVRQETGLRGGSIRLRHTPSEQLLDLDNVAGLEGRCLVCLENSGHSG
jgi:hypothetical protein